MVLLEATVLLPAARACAGEVVTVLWERGLRGVHDVEQARDEEECDEEMCDEDVSDEEMLEALLADQAERCDKVVCFDGALWWVTEYVETGSLERVTVRVGGERVSFELPCRAPVRGVQAETLGALAERCVEGGVQAWLESRRSRWVRGRQEMMGFDVSHLPREEFNEVVDVSWVEDSEAAVLLWDSRGSQAGAGVDPAQLREVRCDLWEILKQHPDALTRSTVHRGRHHRTGVRWGESFATLRMGRVLAHALGSSEAELARDALFVGADGFARAWSDVARDVVVSSVEHHGGSERLDDVATAAMALSELEEFAGRNDGAVVVSTPAMTDAAMVLARRWALDRCSVGFHIVSVATGQYGPAVSVLNAEGAVLRQLAVGWTWGAALYGAVSKTSAGSSPGAAVLGD
jgi:hypothetical protein